MSDKKELTTFGQPFKVGDRLRISGSAGSKNDGEFHVTGVDTGRGVSRTAVVTVRRCPECSATYVDLHPATECRIGTVERIMES